MRWNHIATRFFCRLYVFGPASPYSATFYKECLISLKGGGVAFMSMTEAAKISVRTCVQVWVEVEGVIYLHKGKIVQFWKGWIQVHFLKYHSASCILFSLYWRMFIGFLLIFQFFVSFLIFFVSYASNYIERQVSFYNFSTLPSCYLQKTAKPVLLTFWQSISFVILHYVFSISSKL